MIFFGIIHFVKWANNLMSAKPLVFKNSHVWTVSAWAERGFLSKGKITGYRS